MSTKNIADPTKEYLRIQPAEVPLDPTDVKEHARRFRWLLEAEENGSILDWLLGVDDKDAAIECLLVSSGDTPTRIEYYLGTDPDLLPQLKGLLRGQHPDTYRIIEQAPDSAFFEDIETTEDASEETPATDNGGADPFVAAVECRGRPARSDDWQTGLQSFEGNLDGDSSLPLSTVLQTMAESPDAMIYQSLITPMPDWTALRDRRVDRLETDRDRLSERFWDAVDGWIPDGSGTDADSDHGNGHERTSAAATRRLERLNPREADRSFVVVVRGTVIGPRNCRDRVRRTAEALGSGLEAIGHSDYEVVPTLLTDDDSWLGFSDAGSRVLEALCDRKLHPPDYERLTSYWPGVPHTSPGLVADSTEISNFLTIGGDSLTTAGRRALGVVPKERTSLPRPSEKQLAPFRAGAGLSLGVPLTQDDTPDDRPISIPPRLQRLHQALVGMTGSGKSMVLGNAMLDNHAATDGLDVLIDPKGDGLPLEYLRCHFARHGSLENVYYFDVSSAVPAFSFFDITADLEAGVSREAAVENKIDHYFDIISKLMDEDRFHQAVRSLAVIKDLLRAEYDPVTGADAFGQADLETTANRMGDRHEAPSVTDEDTERRLENVVAEGSEMFSSIMGGVATRIEKASEDRRLAKAFADGADSDTEDAASFDFGDHLDEDAVVILDLGGLRADSRHALTLLALSNLWTALKRRSRRGSADTEHPLVNVYLEEVASIASTDLFEDLLAEARGFDCSLTLSLQFPEQLRQSSERAYHEVLNNTGAILAGNISVQERLAERLATDEMPKHVISNRLGALRRGEWVTSLTPGFNADPLRPFAVTSSSFPAGHPDGDQPLADATRADFTTSFEQRRTRVYETHARLLADTRADDAERRDAPRGRLGSTLPHSTRLPEHVEYREDRHALACTECGNQYDPTAQGMKRTIRCCGSLEAVERDDIPVCRASVKLTADERAATDFTDRQLQYLQAVHNAQQGRYDPELEYDIVHDSMVRLREYTGIDREAIQELIEADLLTDGDDHPHRLRSMTPEGRDLLNASYRRGIDHGHRRGDLNESSQHVLAVEVGRRYVESEHVGSQDSAAVEAVVYHDVDDGRLDFAGLDDAGEVVIAGEAECHNNDTKTAVPKDFDKLASVVPEKAIWVVMNRPGGHEVLHALNDPADDEPRIDDDDMHSPNTAPHEYTIDEPGFTEAVAVGYAKRKAEMGTE